MSRLRYSYTPRRRVRSRLRQRDRNWRALLFPIALVALVVVLAVVFRRGGNAGGAPATNAACVTADCLPVRAAPAAQRTDAQPATHSPADFPADSPAPPITGFAAAVMEEPCGHLLYGINERARMAPASLTKIMTAIIAADKLDLSRQVKVDVNGGELSARTDSTVMGIAPGETLTVKDLLYGMLLPSGNDAALQLAEAAGGDVSTFVDIMNQKASDLGLTDTHFTNPHGLDDSAHYTSPYDIAMMARVLLRNPDLARIVRTQNYQPSWQGPALKNINLFISQYPGAIGVKTGYTDAAGQTIVAAAERDGRRIIVSVFKSQDMYVDASSLLDWAFSATRPSCASAEAVPASGR